MVRKVSSKDQSTMGGQLSAPKFWKKSDKHIDTYKKSALYTNRDHYVLSTISQTFTFSYNLLSVCS